MQTRSVVNRHAPRFLVTCAILFVLAFSTLAPSVAAEDTAAYTAAQIHDWLVDTISSTEVTVTTAPSVTLDATNHRMIVQDFAFAARGITVGLNELRVTFDGSNTIAVVGELDVFGKLPRFECDLELEYLDSADKLQVADISNIEIADSFTPTLSPGDISTIVDVLNKVLDASELSVVSPGGDLTGIDVVDDAGTPKLQTTWTTSAPALLTEAEIAEKLDGMVTTLAEKATDYLQAVEGDWNIDVDVVSNTSLDIDASFTAFGITAALSEFNVTFDTLTATVTNATFSVDSKTVTWSAVGEVACSNFVPSLTMTSLSVTGQHTGFNNFIADIEPALLDAIDQAVDDIVLDTGLTFPFSSISAITVDGDDVVLHSADEVTVDLVLKAGWNMVSVPVIPDDTSVSSVFAGSIAVYTWNPNNKSYIVPTTVDPRLGYWVAVDSDDTISVTGTPVLQWDSSLLVGWSMVGSVQPRDVPVGEFTDDPDGSVVRSSIYGWNATTKSYNAATALEIGKGYWMLSTSDCDISVS